MDHQSDLGGRTPLLTIASMEHGQIVELLLLGGCYIALTPKAVQFYVDPPPAPRLNNNIQNKKTTNF